MKKIKNTIQDFESNIYKTEECWLWVKETSDKYGLFNFSNEHGKTNRAHAASWLIYKGSTNGLNVCHSCDNTKCVNPEHLWLGTQKQNLKDMTDKNRRFTKVNNETKEKIIELWNTKNYTQVALSKRFNISRAHVQNIINIGI